MRVPDHTESCPPQRYADVGVVVLDNGHDGTHAGIVFVADPDAAPPKFLHLAFHHDLVVGPPPGAGLYGAVDVPKRLKNHLLMLLEQVEPANHDTINYAFGFSGATHFDLNTARIVVGGDDVGLTCSTFVLAVFASVGFPLLVLTPWAPRAGDAEVMASIINLLQRREDEGHIEAGYTEKARRNAEGASRYRPEDVLAAATEPRPPPHTQSTIDARSAAIRAWLFPPSDTATEGLP